MEYVFGETNKCLKDVIFLFTTKKEHRKILYYWLVHFLNISIVIILLTECVLCHLYLWYFPWRLPSETLKRTLLSNLMRTFSALVRNPTMTAIIIPSEYASVQRRYCAPYKYLWGNTYFLNTWVGGYARRCRPNWIYLGAKLVGRLRR